MAREGRGRPLGQDGGEARAVRPKARQRGAVARDEAKPQPDSESATVGPVILAGSKSRAIFDEALQWARDALAAPLTAREADLLKALSPKALAALAACIWLAAFGAVASFQPDVEKEGKQRGMATARAKKLAGAPKATKDRRALVGKLREKAKGRSKRARATRIQAELEKRGIVVCVRTVERDLEK